MTATTLRRLIVMGLIVLWEALPRSGLIPELFLPSLSSTLVAGWNEWGHRASVFIAKAASYDADLERTIALGLRELGLVPAWARGKTVLLKPNLVEPSRDAPEINTHPYVVRATAEVFRSWGAASVTVAPFDLE